MVEGEGHMKPQFNECWHRVTHVHPHFVGRPRPTDLECVQCSRVGSENGPCRDCGACEVHGRHEMAITNMERLRAFLRGLVEFRRPVTQYNYPLVEDYETGREVVHILTRRKYDA